MCVLRRADAPTAKLIELIKVCELDLKLQSGAHGVAPCQRNQDAAVEAIVAGRSQLPPDKVQGLLPAGRH